MAQESQDMSVNMATLSMGCKRGQPGKDDIPAYEPSKRTRRHKVAVAHGEDPFVGQVVSGVLDGRFDAGYLLTVRVGGRGNVLRGFVFEPGLSVPISAANDIAPNVKMFRREEVPLQSSATQLPDFTQTQPIAKKYDIGKHCYGNESALLSKGNSANLTKDLNANVWTQSSGMMTDNDQNNVSGNWKKDLQSANCDIVPTDETQNLQSISFNVKFSSDMHIQEAIGDSGIIDTKPITHVSLTMSESKQAIGMSDADVDLTNSNRTAQLPEGNDMTLVNEMSQSPSESKKRIETSDARDALAIDNKTACVEKAVTNMKLPTESSPTKTSESKRSAMISDVKPGLINGGPVVACNATLQKSDHGVEEVDLGAIEARHTMESSVAASDIHNSVQLGDEDEITAGTDNGIMGFVEQESSICGELLESKSKAIESCNEIECQPSEMGSTTQLQSHLTS